MTAVDTVARCSIHVQPTKHICIDHIEVYCQKTTATLHWLCRVLIKCPTCLTTVNSLRSLSAHYSQHCTNGNASVMCVMKQCDCEFDVYSSYTAHMSRHHKQLTVASVRDGLIQSFEIETVNGADGGNACDRDGDDGDDPLQQENMTADFERNMAMVFFKLKELYMLPSSTVQMLIQDFTNAVELSESYTLSRVNSVCQNEQLEAGVRAEILAAVDKGLFTKTVFTLSTDWKRKQYYKANFPFIAPVEYTYVSDGTREKFVSVCPFTDYSKSDA